MSITHSEKKIKQGGGGLNWYAMSRRSKKAGIENTFPKYGKFISVHLTPFVLFNIFI